MTHPIIEKILKLETLEKELLGEQRLSPVILSNRPSSKPIESQFINLERQESKTQYFNVTDDERGERQVISNQRLIKLLEKGGKLYTEGGTIYIEVPSDEPYETDKQYHARIKTERKLFQSELKRWEPVEVYYSKLQYLKQAIADLTAEIDKELENPEILAIVETYLKSKSNQTQL